MAEERADIGFGGVAVRLEADAPAAALRYVVSDGEFAVAAGVAGAPIPATLEAHDTGDELLLAWRSPTETLCLARSAARLAQLCRALDGIPGGCCVDLSGALSVVHLCGERIPDLLARIGSAASLPGIGEARRSRMADVPVLALCVNAPEVLLVVDRAYAAHLLGWIRETLLDFE
jgi:heterotetrameric sarcosine oxidase gamma subunit